MKTKNDRHHRAKLREFDPGEQVVDQDQVDHVVYYYSK